MKGQTARSRWNSGDEDGPLRKAYGFYRNMDLGGVGDTLADLGQLFIRRHLNRLNLARGAVGYAHNQPSAAGIADSNGIFGDLSPAQQVRLKFNPLSFRLSQQRSQLCLCHVNASDEKFGGCLC
jgi:hypothetical protein